MSSGQAGAKLERMVDAAEQGTRTQILRVALDAFSARGYHATSLSEIAEEVGVSKAAVLYHFPSKSEILAGLVDPFLRAFEAVLEAAELSADPVWAAIENTLEVFIAHRYLLRMNLHDLAIIGQAAVAGRFQAAMVRANRLVSGGRSDLDGRVRAAQAIAALSDPVVLLADEPVEALRASVLRGVRRLLDFPAIDDAPRAREDARRGRPRAMDPSMIEAARRLRDAGMSVTQIAAELGVARATVYRAVSK